MLSSRNCPNSIKTFRVMNYSIVFFHVTKENERSRVAKLTLHSSVQCQIILIGSSFQVSSSTLSKFTKTFTSFKYLFISFLFDLLTLLFRRGQKVAPEEEEAKFLIQVEDGFLVQQILSSVPEVNLNLPLGRHYPINCRKCPWLQI